MTSDGPQSKETELDRINREIGAKVNEWHLHGWDPEASWGINVFILSTRVDVLVDMVKEQLELSDEEWAVKYGNKLLHNLTVCLEKLLEMQRSDPQKPKIDIFRGMPHDLNGGMN